MDLFRAYLDDISDAGARGFTISAAAGPRAIFIVRQAERAFAYENRCPHTGVNLDCTPDQFMDGNGTHLQCATHGALFRIQDGYCVYGPCAGQCLAPVPIRVQKGQIELLPPGGSGARDPGPNQPLG